MKNKKYNNFIVISLILIATGLSLFFSQILLQHVSAQATYQTPTPNAEGQILYTVQEGDNCTRIFLLTGVTINEIISLNGLGEDCNIYPGDQIVLGVVPTPSGTDVAQTTTAPAEQPPVPTSEPGYAEICIVLFEDVDGNGMRTEDEFYLEGGAVSVNDRSGSTSLTGMSVGGDPELVDPLCFEDVPEGEYNITVGIPEGYNATTVTNYALQLQVGNKATLDFGAQTALNVAEPEEAITDKRSPILAIAGALVLLGGVGLGVYMWFLKRSNRAAK